MKTNWAKVVTKTLSPFYKKAYDRRIKEEKEFMKAFKMIRKADESGVSGIGKVLEGIVFSDGQTVIKWCVKDKPNSIAIYPTYEAFKLIHIDSHPTNETEVIFVKENK